MLPDRMIQAAIRWRVWSRRVSVKLMKEVGWIFFCEYIWTAFKTLINSGDYHKTPEIIVMWQEFWFIKKQIFDAFSTFLNRFSTSRARYNLFYKSDVKFVNEAFINKYKSEGFTNRKQHINEKTNLIRK